MSDVPSNESNAGPGCMPAILAGTLLLGIAGFVCCGVSTWYLYQQRTVLVERTLSQTLVPAIEQSRLEPMEKEDVLKELEAFSEKLRKEEVENWQAAAVMQRLVRLPILEWGDLQAVEEVLRQDEADHADALKQLSRLRRAVELDKVTMIDMEDVLAPVLANDGTPTTRRSLITPISESAALDVANRAKIVANNNRVPDNDFGPIDLAPIVHRQIELGLSEGSY